MKQTLFSWNVNCLFLLAVNRETDDFFFVKIYQYPPPPPPLYHPDWILMLASHVWAACGGTRVGLNARVGAASRKQGKFDEVIRVHFTDKGKKRDATYDLWISWCCSFSSAVGPMRPKAKRNPFPQVSDYRHCAQNWLRLRTASRDHRNRFGTVNGD